MAKMRMGLGFGGVSGRSGNAVFAQTQYGTVLRERPFVPRRRSQTQDMISLNLRRANAAWRGLSGAQVQAWQLYCLSLTETSPATGLPLTPQAPHVFLGYATKFLQVNPDAEIPQDPPATPFYGDSLRCTVEGAQGGFWVHASAANAPGVTTEVLVQRLRHIHNRPQAKSYTSAGFTTFTPNTHDHWVEKIGGTYAIAIRFVEQSTGRKTAIYPIGAVVVTYSG